MMTTTTTMTMTIAKGAEGQAIYFATIRRQNLTWRPLNIPRENDSDVTKQWHPANENGFYMKMGILFPFK